MKLNISPALKLPDDTVMSTLVVYGGKGMGKANFGAVLAEELSKARMKFSVLDPLGVCRTRSAVMPRRLPVATRVGV